MLHRQWQLGELDGNDSGSPIAVTIRRTESPLSAYRRDGPGGTGAVLPYDPRALPLEPLVEAERVRGLPDRHRRLAAETGAHSLRLLRVRGLADLIVAFRSAFTVRLAPSPPEAVGTCNLRGGQGGIAWPPSVVSGARLANDAGRMEGRQLAE